MASLIKRRNLWYARVSLWNGHRQRFKEIPLRTKYREDALLRLNTIEKVEKDIKDGIEFTFPWLSGTNITKILRLTIYDAAAKFKEERKYEGLSPSTLSRNNNSLEHFITIVGKHTPINEIADDHIMLFKKYSLGNLNHSPGGVNINLRLIKTFLRWCKHKGYLDSVPQIKMVKTPQSAPSYLSDADWDSLMALKSVDPLFKRIFYFYRETGCRLSEPFHGELRGSWLVIPAIYTKSKVEKEIELTIQLKNIWYEINTLKINWAEQGRKFENLTGKISKCFLSVCRETGLNHRFHDLRHTFAVRKYLENGNIYKIRDLLGHSSVKTTEIYARFNRMRLKEDFPSITEGM